MGKIARDADPISAWANELKCEPVFPKEIRSDGKKRGHMCMHLAFAQGGL